MTIKLVGYQVEVYGQEEEGELTATEIELQLHPNELEQALGEFLSGQLDREVFAKVTRIVDEPSGHIVHRDPEDDSGYLT